MPADAESVTIAVPPWMLNSAALAAVAENTRVAPAASLVKEPGNLSMFARPQMIADSRRLVCWQPSLEDK
jgi:hypothetical protein